MRPTLPCWMSLTVDAAGPRHVAAKLRVRWWARWPVLRVVTLFVWLHFTSQGRRYLDAMRAWRASA